MEPILVTLKDIQEFRPVADLNEARINPYIREAQINDLRPFLGDALYYDLITNTTTTPNQELINGKAYTFDGKTIDFNGLRPMVVYFALARFITNNQINITSYGVVQKTLNQSQPVSANVINQQVTELRGVALFYQEQTRKFLDTNTTTYPLWTSGESEEPQTGLNFFFA